MNIKEILKLSYDAPLNQKRLSVSNQVTIGGLIDRETFGLNISAEEAAGLSMIPAPHTLINSESEQIWPKKRRLINPYPAYPLAY